MASFQHFPWAKFSILTASLASFLMLSACAKKQETVTLNIGFQKYGLLPIVKERGDLDKALKAKGIEIK